MEKLRRLQQCLKLTAIGVSRERPADKQQRLMEQLVVMGGVYIKFAQLLLLKQSSKQPQQARLLRKTYDTTPAEQLDIQQLLRAELGGASSSLHDISPLPIAGGSFGQVYSARLSTGQPVIVKVIKPSVLRTIRLDLRLLAIACWLLGLSRDSGIDLNGLFKEFRQLILRELDYDSELFYAQSLHAKYRNHPSLIIPETYEALSTRHIIVQERIQGLALTDVLAAKQQGIDPADFVRNHLGSDLPYQMGIFGQEMLASMLQGDVTHGDPHPGNVILLGDNRIALIDFGICTTGPRDKRAFFNLVKQYEKIYTNGEFDVETFTFSVIELFVHELTDAVYALDRYSGGEVSKKVFEGISQGVQSIYAGSLHDIDTLVSNKKFLQIFNAVINEDNRFGLRITIDQPEFMRATLLYISLMEALDIKETVLSAVYGNVVTAFQDVPLPSLSEHTSPERAVTVLAEWLEQIASRDIFLYELVTKKIGKGELYV